MNIIAVLHKDSDNFVLVPLIEAFISYGHTVKIYSIYTESNHLYMFHDKDIDIQNINELKKENIAVFDFMILTTRAYGDTPWLMDLPIYTISYNSAYYDEPMHGSDLMITRGIEWWPRLKAGKRSECAWLVVGDPKHDTWNIDGIEEKKNRLLFIDSGHYPFSVEGKKIVADFIIDVCNKFPDYELVIKPRFLKTDKNITHKNTIFLYDLIEEKCKGKLPENLIMLKEHRNIEGLIASSHAVITMYTTAYMDVAVQGKPLIILDNLPNEENVELRIETHWNVAREIMFDSGCLVDYKKAIDYLPDGIMCNKQHINKHIYSTGRINKKIVKSIEYIYETCLFKGKYPKIQKYYYDLLEDTCTPDNDLDLKKLCDIRKKNYLYCKERYFYKNINFYPTDAKLTNYIEELFLEKNFSEKSLDELVELFTKKTMEYMDQIPNDIISQDYFLASMIGKTNYKYIFKFPKERVLDEPFYNYIYGRACFEEEDYDEAGTYLHKYLNAIVENDFSKTIQDLEAYRLSGLYYCGLSEMKLSNYQEAKKCFLECEKITNGNHIKAKEMLDMIDNMTE